MRSADINIRRIQVIHMQPGQLDNCRICGKLFLRDHTDYCLDCYKKTEQDFKRVADFLTNEQNRFATIEEVSLETEVPVKQVADFIRDGRIYAEDYPNLGYRCAHCDKLIKRQLLCDDCFNQFSSEVNLTLKRENLQDEIQSKQVNTSQYWQLKKNK